MEHVHRQTHDSRRPPHFSRSRLLLGVCSLLLVYLLAACGTGGSSTAATSVSPSASTPVPQGNQGAPANMAPLSCTRISEATVSLAIGIQLAPGTVAGHYSAPDGGDSLICMYKDAATSQTQEVVISYISGSSASLLFNLPQKDAELAKRQPVSGLGDKAFFETQKYNLHVLKGNLYFIVSLTKLSEQGASKLLVEARHIAMAILANS